MRARILCFLVGYSLTSAVPAAAQSMREIVNRLFIFGGDNAALFLTGSAGLPATQVHGDHYIPAETESNALLLSFFERSIAANIASFPLSSTVASETYQFVDGVPVPTSSSFGPIFAERAQTIGRGRFNVGGNATRIPFSRLRGIPTSDLQLTFVHQNVDFPNCSVIFDGDCAEYGIPLFEHDVIDLNLDMDIRATILALYGTFGITDRLDLSLAVPIVSLSVEGTSTARIIPSTGVPIQHFFAGTPDDPVLLANSASRGSASGIGDVAVRVKAHFLRGTGLDMAILGEARAPTGRAEDFLGTGEWGWRGLFIASGVYGGFSPHTNFGYARRGGDGATDLFEGVLGFDQQLAPWATVAFDVLGLFAIGSGGDDFAAEPVVLTHPYRQEVRVTNIPNLRDNQVNGSMGFKFQVPGGVILIANALVPLNQGGMRADWVGTFGLEYAR